MPPKKSVQVEGAAAPADAAAVTAVPAVTPNADAELPVVASPAVIGYVVRCHRERGIWRAKRFWPPENVSVRADELADGDLEALESEPLLSVSPVLE